MESTDALCVVLNVTEVNQLEVMRKQLDATEGKRDRMMKAYHFQQTMRAFGATVLTRMNALLGKTPRPNLTREEFDEIVYMDDSDEYDGAQYLVEIDVFYDCDSYVMAFVEPTLDPEWSYLLPHGPQYDGFAIPLADLETLADFLGDHPDVYTSFMSEMTHDKVDTYEEYNTPSNGIISG